MFKKTTRVSQILVKTVSASELSIPPSSVIATKT